MFSQMESLICLLFLVLSFEQAACLVPPRFQWKTIDFAWEQQDREVAIARGDYIPENNMPTGIARWKDKLRPILLELRQEPLRPYPCWSEGFYCHTLSCSPSNSTVISTFRVHVDRSDRLWVVDNSISDMTETGGKGTFAYITDMGSHAIIVYSLNDRMAWRVESPYFHFDPHAMDFKVGGIEFYSRDGVSGCALSHKKNNGLSVIEALIHKLRPVHLIHKTMFYFTLSEAMDFSQVNFRVLTAPVASFIRSTSCEKHSSIFSLMSRRKSKSSCSCNKIK
ncbi:Yellow-c [Operophtera brumata]|uniref:Yellow-c n=1 Tax=Operophtera brumata TaxID=104452 RepID=A0A0L7LCT4_OPEBR|nr:Yellow-c [Operophtera brumata]